MRVAVTKNPLVATFAMYRGVSKNNQLTQAVKYFVCKTRAFQAGRSKKETSDWLSSKAQYKDLKLLVRSDARVKNMDDKIDTLANQLLSLNLLSKEKRSRFFQSAAGC